MPELPEVETVRRGLERALVGERIARVRLVRKDVVSGARTGPALLERATIGRLVRRGKSLAIEAAPLDGRAAGSGGSGGRAIAVHLGMTGQLLVVGREEADAAATVAHTHVVWSLASGGAMVFRDPRRFGGVWTHTSLEELRAERWGGLGPDGLDDPAGVLSALLSARRRSVRTIKSALLDQGLIAGVGNIYADESLHRAGISPRRKCTGLSAEECTRLAVAVGSVLREAVIAGGSTLRDYRGADGALGAFQGSHRVYGRGGEACLTCRSVLASATLGQRTTVWCPTCQPARPAKAGTEPPLLAKRVIHTAVLVCAGVPRAVDR